MTAAPARKRVRGGALALLGGAVLLTLAWPAPSSADTLLGGYSATARAEAVRVEIFEPALPLPSNPQIDGGIAYARANTETGPTTRATASYLWPGDVVGDGFDQLTGHSGDKYPVQVNSRYPATSYAPAKNTAQVTDGNGMTTSTDGTTTQGTVTGAGVAGTNVVTNPLAGLCQILINKNCPPQDKSTPSPVPVQVGANLAALVTLTDVYSQSTVTLAAKTITATATTHAAQLKLLAGLITISGIEVTSTTVSDGTKATTSGTSTISGLTIAGQKIDVGSGSITLGGSGTTAPALPVDVLKLLGIQIQYAPSQRSITGAEGSLDAQGLVISVDTKVLKETLGLSSVLSPIAKIVSQIPKFGDQLGPVLGLGPRIVLNVGAVSSTAQAQPAYIGPPITGGVGPPAGGTGGGSVPPAGGTTGGVTTGNQGGGGTTTQPTGGGSTTPTTPTQPVAYSLPGLGNVPRLLIFGGLLLAGAIGWLFRAAGGFLVGAGRLCSFGLRTGVPDLRKG